MPKFNTFETQIDEILNEAMGDVLNAAQTAMKRMTPGSNLFDGPGAINNEYDEEKNYYPNIRSGLMGLVNKSKNDATQALIIRINQLKQYDVWNPNENLPRELRLIVSTQYSQDFIENEEKYLQDALRNLEEAYMRLPRDNQSERLYHQLINVDTRGMSKSQLSQHKIKTSKARDDIEALIQLRDYMNKKNYKDLSMLQKAHVQTYIIQFNEAFERWYQITRATASLSGIAGGNNQQVDTKDERIEGTVLKKDGTIYRDQWVNFLNTVQNAIVGAGQQRFTIGANPYSLLIGKAAGTYKYRGEVQYTGARAPGTVSPEILKHFHEKIMSPLFITGKDKVLIYVTPKQWESISEGGRIYKGVTGLGKQAWTAGQNAPKVSL